MGSGDVVVPTRCTDWSLNLDHDTQKQFWWNSTHSISIWQTNLKVPNVEAATDPVVWHHFLQYQSTAVYKMCDVCCGPEQNDDLRLCCSCGSTVHVQCSQEASPAQLRSIDASGGFTSLMRQCKKCAKTPHPEAKHVPEEIHARRAIIRALACSEEYTSELTQELKALLTKASAKLTPAQDDQLLTRCQQLIQSHFQPHSSAQLLTKQRIPSKGGGIGVVAASDIPRLTVIGVYPGYEDPLSGEQAKSGRPGPKYSLVDLNCADWFNRVFEEFALTYTPFINEPEETETSNTAWIQEPHRPEGRLSVMTVRDIAAGEELLIGYGPLYPRTYPYNYDAYAFHHVDGYNDPPCFALWHWKTLEEKDAEFVLYCGYDRAKDSYTYWETEEEASAAQRSSAKS